MKCSIIQRLLNRYIDNELPGKDIFDIKEHLAGCAQCTHKLNELTTLKGFIGGITPYTANPYLWTRIAESIHRGVPIPISILTTKIFKIWIPVATAFIVLSTIALFYVPEPQRPLRENIVSLENALLNMPRTPDNLENITINVLVYTNGTHTSTLDTALLL